MSPIMRIAHATGLKPTTHAIAAAPPSKLNASTHLAMVQMRAWVKVHVEVRWRGECAVAGEGAVAGKRVGRT